MIHRVVFGSIERFIGILIEHFAGALPAWLAPVQVKILPISEHYFEYAESVRETLRASGFRVEVDKRSEKVGYKIREAQLEKVPYMLIVGEKEQENKNVSVRSRKDGDKGAVDLGEFISSLAEEVESKSM